MDTAMRDLDRIQEHEDDAPSRKVAMLVMAALSTVGLVFAMGVLLRDGSAAGQLDADPLDRLDALDRAALGSPEAAEKALLEELPAPALTFHTSLTEAQSPELAAAIAAADAELLALEEERSEAPARALVLALEEAPSEAAAPEPAPARPTKKRAAPVEDELAPSEERSGYALQVVSYKSLGEAQTFAKELERRDYPVFIERAVIEGRGEFHRVRLGPFAGRGEAQRVRAQFEESEQIHTLLVRLDR